MRKAAALLVVSLVPVCAFGQAASAPSETPEETLRRAAQLATENKTARAAEAYRDFLKLHAEHSQALEARYQLAKCLDNLGYVDEAVAELVKVTQSQNKRFRHRPDALYMLGKLYGSMKKFPEATGTFEELLKEGAGLFEDEVLSLCGGYYAIGQKCDEAAAKFNILKRRQGSRYAEQAAYKTALIWLRAEKLDLAVDAVQDLHMLFPQNTQARGLLLQVADLFRKKRMYDKAIATCQQLQSRFGQSREAEAIGYVLGLCYRDRKEYDKAVAALKNVARFPENLSIGLAAEALMLAADIYYGDMAQPDEAMGWYDEAAKLAWKGQGERKAQVLEHCYFRLAEHYYGRQKWGVALEYYSLLRKVGTKINVLPRILKCQAMLEQDLTAAVQTQEDVRYIEETIKKNPGTFAAAEGEVFLVDRRLQALLRRKRYDTKTLNSLIEDYGKILARYPKKVLSEMSLESYLYAQIAQCHSHGLTKAELTKAIEMYDKALQVDPDTPYKTEILSSVAQIADAVGDRKRSREVHRRLFELAEKKVEVSADDARAREMMVDHLRAMLSQTQADAVDESVALAHEIIRRRGRASEAARHALFYIGELYYLKKRFSDAAKAYKNFMAEYGPKTDLKGEVILAPWRPAPIDEAVLQVYEAAVRVAHCWYMQAHTQNMVAAYDWMLRNFPVGNKYVAEAAYWLALENVKGRKKEDRENRARAAQQLWTRVVHPSFDFTAPDFSRGYHPWLRDGEMAKYVKSAILKSGQFYSELGDHERAAAIFEQYLKLYPPPPQQRPRRGELLPLPKIEQMHSTARYALGREYIALDDVPKLIETYRPYLDELRNDRFRISGLRILGHYALRTKAYDVAVEAMATILDEYGYNEKDADGKPVPVPRPQQLRARKYAWDGLRAEPPPGLDLGEVRFVLGYIYYEQQDWARIVKVLWDFVENPQLFTNRSRSKALYMIAQGCYKSRNYDKGLQVALKLIGDHPRFEAVEEVYVFATRGLKETRRWSAIERLYQRFVQTYPRSLHRPHMDLLAALAVLKQGRTEEGVKKLRGIAESDTYQDVKGAACFYLGEHFMAATPPDYAAAMKCLDQAVGLYPQDVSCLAAAKCCIELKRWEEAKVLLYRTTREFPGGDRKVVEEAGKLLPAVLKELVNR